MLDEHPFAGELIPQMSNFWGIASHQKHSNDPETQSNPADKVMMLWMEAR
jgi:hypothetical protein